MAGEKDSGRPLREGYQPEATEVLKKAYTPGKEIQGGYQPEASIADFVPPQGGSALVPEPQQAQPVASSPTAPSGAAPGTGQGGGEE
jgi:hypothetical protein